MIASTELILCFLKIISFPLLSTISFLAAWKVFVSLRIQIECGKIMTRKTPNTDTFCKTVFVIVQFACNHKNLWTIYKTMYDGFLRIFVLWKRIYFPIWEFRILKCFSYEASFLAYLVTPFLGFYWFGTRSLGYPSIDLLSSSWALSRCFW